MDLIDSRIVRSDCIEFMRRMPRNCVDLIITDPPYGDDVAYGYMNKTIENNENPLINCLALAECYRILRKNRSVYNFTNWKHYPFLVEFIMKYTKFKIRHVIVWKKKNFGMGWAFRHQYEMILVLEKGKPRYSLTNFSDVQDSEYIVHNSKTHPHQKPLDLISKMIEHSSKKGDLVFDPFCGSGSTCLAAEIKGRKWIGVEKDSNYVRLARKRLNKGGFK